mmetsp:Transcript_6218/g.9120  ORF Transcript_6218/g.9120 Transcript_6218/m.9120 type:complete len:107 (-) Transcript_6218:289-609(-)
MNGVCGHKILHYQSRCNMMHWRVLAPLSEMNTLQSTLLEMNSSCFKRDIPKKQEFSDAVIFCQGDGEEHHLFLKGIFQFTPNKLFHHHLLSLTLSSILSILLCEKR